MFLYFYLIEQRVQYLESTSSYGDGPQRYPPAQVWVGGTPLKQFEEMGSSSQI
jgi:hypothetical protein